MKILFIDNSGFSFIDGKVCVYSATGKFGVELLQQGYDVEYFQILTNRKSVVNPFYLKENGIKVVFVKQSKCKLFTYLKGYILLFIRIFKTDFVYLSFPNNFKIALIISKLLGKKVGLYIRGQLSIDSKLSTFLFKNSDIILGESKVLLDKIELKINKNITHVFLPMIPFDYKWINVTRTYNKKDNFTLLYLGRIDLQKGLFELVEAIFILKSKTNKKFILNIYGSGADQFILEKYVREKGISDIVLFCGSANSPKDIFDAYSSSDLYILPTYHEGFGRTLLEAMMAGTPIVTTIVGGIPALMKKDYNCFEIRPKSVDSIVNTLLYIMDDYSICKSRVKNSFDFIDKYFSSLKFTHSQMLDNCLQKYKVS